MIAIDNAKERRLVILKDELDSYRCPNRVSLFDIYSRLLLRT